jgi:oxalate decarboxylase
MNEITRRGILGAAALTAGGLVVGSAVRAADEKKNDDGNRPEPDPVPPFKFGMESQKKGRFYDGGSAKEANVENFPISRGIAAVSMRLKPGGLRELHWHPIAAEWAYVIKGRVRTTAFDPAGDYEINEFGPGDVWYFPRGHGHALLGLGKEESHFILGFDDGAFSEFGTFSITDWVGHTPPEVLAKNLGVPAATFKDFPKKEMYIIQGPAPSPLPERPEPGTLKSPPNTHKYELAAQKGRTFPGGSIRIVSQKEFPISTTMTGAIMHLKPGALRELHWHPNAVEWQYYIEGKGRMTLFGSHGQARTEQFGPGDVAYIPKGFGHYIENTGDSDCRVLLIFNSGTYEEIALSSWMASNPPDLVATNFGISEELVKKFPKQTATITSAQDRRP